MNNFEKQPQLNPNKEEKGFIDKILARIQEKFRESRLPTKEALGYESTVGVYGGKINYDSDGKMVFDMRGIISQIDRAGDAILRTYDEHTTKNPLEMFNKHPNWFFRFLTPAAKRYRGAPQEIAENAKRLGLEEEYALHDWGIEIKDSEIYKSGRPLQDIFRSDLIENNDLNEIDRFKALAQSAEYIRNIHDKFGAIGEVLPSDIIFRKKENASISEPVLNIPDIIYNQEKQTSEKDKKTTDLLDLTMSIGIEELRRSKDWNETQKAIRTILESYKDKEIIELLESFVKRGRLTMQGNKEAIGLSKTSAILRPLMAMHNKARLNFDKDTTSNLRELIVVECEDYLKNLI